jgi:LEA14-like dessication related protein
MKRFLTPLFSLLLLATFIVTGCSNNSRIIATGLEVEVTGVERESDGSVAVSWQIKNPNIAPYMFSRLSHKIQLNGVTLGSITDLQALPVPANSNAGRTSKLTTLDAAANRAVTEAINAGSANYRIETQITILVYDESVEKSNLSNSGTVTVKTK